MCSPHTNSHTNTLNTTRHDTNEPQELPLLPSPPGGAAAVVSSSCFRRFLARISFMASSMERVSRLLATGTEGEINNVDYQCFFFILHLQNKRLGRTGGEPGASPTAAVGSVGLERVCCVFGCRGADQVTVLVSVVRVRTRLGFRRLTGRSFFQCCLFLLEK